MRIFRNIQMSTDNFHLVGVRNVRCMSHLRGGNRRGQALTELALFGSVLLLVMGFLVRYGMTMNYRQGLSMQTYRAAYKKAKVENDKLIESRTGARSIAYTKIVERAIPDPSNQFGLTGFSESTTYMEDSSVSWTQRLFYDIQQPYKRTDMPIAVYDFGSKKYEFTTLGFKEILVVDGKLAKEEGGQIEFLKFEQEIPELKINEGNQAIPIQKVSDLPDKKSEVLDEYFSRRSRVPVTKLEWDGEKSWHWEEIGLSEVEKGMMVDLDGDAKEERVLERSGGSIWVLDNDEAEIKEGIYITYIKEMDKGGSLIKNEYPGLIVNLAKLNVTEDFFYRIDLNKVSQKVIDQVRDNGGEDLLISKNTWDKYYREVVKRTYIWESILRHLQGNEDILFDIDELVRNIKDDINNGEASAKLSSEEAEFLRNFLEERQGDLAQLIPGRSRPNRQVVLEKFREYFRIPNVLNFFKDKRISSATDEPAILLIRKKKVSEGDRGWATAHNWITHDELGNL